MKFKKRNNNIFDFFATLFTIMTFGFALGAVITDRAVVSVIGLCVGVIGTIVAISYDIKETRK